MANESPAESIFLLVLFPRSHDGLSPFFSFDFLNPCGFFSFLPCLLSLSASVSCFLLLAVLLACPHFFSFFSARGTDGPRRRLFVHPSAMARGWLGGDLLSALWGSGWCALCLTVSVEH
ncbi:hypothetical protein TcG_11568 [Trypanosoma cruzi]|nr:hypothetical protein TcG_11568 [Trypanosoma cruzi]